MNSRNVYNLLPASIWDQEADSLARARWNAFADGLTEIKTVFEQIALIRNVDDISGIWLDYLGEILSQRREGRSDAAYRPFLKIAIFRQNSNGSAHILSTIALLVLGAGFRGVRNMYPSIKYLDGNGLFDGQGFFAPVYGFRSEDALYGDGTVDGDGTMPGWGLKQQYGCIEIRYAPGLDSILLNSFQAIMRLAAPSGTLVLFYEEAV